MTPSAAGAGRPARGFASNDSFPWQLKQASDLFELRYGKALVESSRHPGSVPVFGTNGQTGTHDTALFPGPGVILGRKGMGHLGVHWSPSDFWVIDTAYALSPGPDMDIKFSFYLVGYVGLDHLKHGTSNPSLTRDVFGAQYFPVPSIVEQRAIAEVLGALDDKIAANRKVIASISELIDARFRAAEKHPSDETFADVADVGGGGTPKTKVPEFWGGDLPWATPTDVTGLSGRWLSATSRTITDLGLASCASPLYSARSILMTSRATIGAFAVAQRPMAVNQGFIVVNAKEPDLQWWLYAQMRARISEFLSHANGATFLELSRGKFKALAVWGGDPDVVRSFCTDVDILMSKSQSAEVENETLAATRDALLPLLMSGKLRVKDAEKRVGEVV